MVSQTTDCSILDHNERWLAAWEIVSVLTSCLIAEWIISAFAGKGSLLGGIPILLAIGFMVLSHRERGETPYVLGFRFDNFASAARLLVIPTLLAVVLIVLGNWLASDSAFSLRPVRSRLLLVPFWALFQQYALQGFINRRAQLVFGPGLTSVVVVALVFGLVHLPSPVLCLCAVVGAFLWAWVYQRQPNLFALALSHTVASLALSLTIPANYSSILRVGFKYFGLSL